MKKKILYGVVIVLVSLLAACATKPGDKTQPAGTAGAKSPKDLEKEALMAQEELKRQQLLSEDRVYFTFDSSAIDEHSRAVTEAHATYLLENSDITVQLEGHCDERGTREYNLALGERRAQTVAKLMKAFGVPDGQVKIVSFGEEKPIDLGHDESAWRKNRRVVFNYKLK